MAEAVLHRGNLARWKSFMKWSTKQFVLTNETFSLYNQTRGRPTLQGCVHVKDIVIDRKDGGLYFNVKINNSGTVWYLKAPSVSEKNEWVEKLQQAKDSVLHSGALKKWTNVLKGWQSRYFVLYTDRLCYYLSQDHLTQRRGTLVIVDRDVNIVLNTTSPTGFDVHVQGTTWFLRDEEGCRDVWVSKIRAQNSGVYHELDSYFTPDNKVSPGPSTPDCVTKEPVSTLPTAQDLDSDEEACYRKDMECGICIDLLIEPTSLNCGHTYCLNCLSNWWLQNRDKFVCPLCRCKIEYLPAVNVALQNLLTLLFEPEIQKRQIQNNEARTEEREIFDKYWEGRRVNANATPSTGANIRTNAEYEFLRRGMWLIFVLWVLGRCVQSIISPLPQYGPLQQEAETEYIEETADVLPNYMKILVTPGSSIFVLSAMMFCPRVLIIMSYLFWHPAVFHPIAQEIADATYQYCGLAYELKIVTWGSVNPFIWFVPFSLLHHQYLLSLAFALRSILEFWWLALEVRALIRWPVAGPSLKEHLIKTAKELWAFSAMNFAFVFTISLLPWGWLPDVLYNCVLLVISTILLSRSIVMFRNLTQRTNALQLGLAHLAMPGVNVTELDIDASG